MNIIIELIVWYILLCLAVISMIHSHYFFYLLIEIDLLIKKTKYKYDNSRKNERYSKYLNR